MKLYFHKCPRPNFGDDINLWFWQLLFGTKFDDNPSELFVGIGTLLNDKLPDADIVHIFGSGAGYGNSVPSCKSNWKIHCVRGPLTAEKIGVPKSLAIADPAILLPLIYPLQGEKNIGYSFMPHIGIDSPGYRNFIESMGITYLSPSEDAKILLRKINSTKKLITSAMHGAIIADAYRVPWFPVVTSPKILAFKWIDWASTLEVSYKPKKFPTPHFTDVFLKKLRNCMSKLIISKKIKTIIKRNHFQLSNDTIIKTRQEQLLELANKYKKKYL